MPDSQFRFEQVSLKTAFQTLLQEISCEIFVGDRIALVGASGAGKTFLLRLLNRLSEVSQGQLYFEGQEIRQIPVLELRQQVMLVLQESKLLGMTVREALAYPLLLRGIKRSIVQQRISFWLEQLHLPEDWLERTEVQLSVGQRQLVAIGRALVAQPKVLLLDEPTSALDVGRSAQVLAVFKRLAETQQTTIVMVNHQLDLAQQFGNRVFYLNQGRLEQDRRAAEVNWTELKAQLLHTQAQQAEEWE